MLSLFIDSTKETADHIVTGDLYVVFMSYEKETRSVNQNGNKMHECLTQVVFDIGILCYINNMSLHSLNKVAYIPNNIVNGNCTEII